MINIPTKSVSIHGVGVGVDDHGHAIVARDCDLVVLDLAAGKVIKIVRGSYPERCYAADLHVAPDRRAATDAIGSTAIVKAVRDRRHREDLPDQAAPPRRGHPRRQGHDPAQVLAGQPGARTARSPRCDRDRWQGRVFVQDGNHVVIFDTDGKFLGELEPRSIADLAVDRQGYLYVLSRCASTR